MKIYFDMDGVLADWVAGFESTFPVSYEYFNSLPKERYDRYKDLIKKTPKFFYNLPPINYTVSVLKELVANGYDVEILTSAGTDRTKHVVAEKKAWLKKHGINVPFNYTTKSADKAKYATKDSVLIDDRDKSIGPFKQAGGGVIHFKEGIDLRKKLKKFI